MRKKIFFTLFFLLFAIPYSLFANTALAVCPVCTVAAIGGLGLSRWLGIDDVISGIWIGGLILSSSLWLIDWVKKKKPEFPISNFQFSIILSVYFLVILPLYFTLPGIGKLIGGIAIGSLTFLFGVWLDKKVRKIKGQQLFNYQKIVFPVGFLAIISLAFYLITK